MAFKYIIRRILKSFCSKLNLHLNWLASMISSYQYFRLGLCACLDRLRWFHSMKCCRSVYYLNLELLSDCSWEQTLTTCIGVGGNGESSCWEGAQSKKVKKMEKSTWKLEIRVFLTFLLLPSAGSCLMIRLSNYHLPQIQDPNGQDASPPCILHLIPSDALNLPSPSLSGARTILPGRDIQIIGGTLIVEM